MNEENNFIMESDKEVNVLFREFCVLVNSPLIYIYIYIYIFGSERT